MRMDDAMRANFGKVAADMFAGKLVSRRTGGLAPNRFLMRKGTIGSVSAATG
jgi:hypothetical protein